MFLLGGKESLEWTTVVFCWRYLHYYLCHMFPVAQTDLDTMLKGAIQGYKYHEAGETWSQCVSCL